MDNISMEEWIKALLEATAVQREKNEVTKKSLEQEVEEAAGYSRINGRLVKQGQERIDVETRLNKELEAQFGAGKIRAEKQEAEFNRQLKQLNYMMDSNGKLAKTTLELNAYQQKQIESLKKAAAYEQEMEKRQEALKLSALKKSAEDIGKATWGVASSMVKGETSFTTLFPLIDAMGSAVGSAGKGLLSLIPVIGGFAGALFEASTKIAVEGSKLLLQLLQSSLKNFQDMGNSGALVEGGMTALNDQLKTAGMTVDGFKKVVKENASTLAVWGGTVGEGARKFSAAVGELSLKGAGDDLRKLGLTADDMGESAAAFLAQEIRLGRNRQMTEKQLVDGTIQYVKELDLLQKVTGLSRQDAQKQRDELLSDSRYRASIDGMNKENQNGLNALMMKFRDPNMKRGLMDLTSGAIGTKDAAMVTQALGETAADAIQSLKDAKPEDIPKVLDKVMLDFQGSAQNTKDMFGEVYKYLEPGTLINFATIADIAGGKYVTSMEKAKETQDAQIKNTDKLTEATVDAQKQMEIFSKNMLDIANAALPNAAEAVRVFTVAVNQAVDLILKDRPPTAPGTTIPTKPQTDESVRRAQEKLDRAKALGDKEGEKAAQAELDRAKAAAAMAENARRNRQGTPGAPVKPNGPAAPTTSPPASPSVIPTPVPSGSPSTAPNSKKTADQLIKFGSGSGDKSHFEMLDPNVRDSFMKMIEEYGKPVEVTSSFRSYDEQKAIWDKARAGPTPDIRIQDNGIPVAKPGTSKHEQKKAIDLSKNDMLALYDASTKSGTDYLNNYGFKYDRIKDAVHIEKARFGGMFDGPDSGYPVMLHGQEAVVPAPQFAEIKEVLNSVSKKSLSSEMSTTVSTLGTNESLNILKSLNSIMSEKFDQMITQMERSTDIQSRLLNNSMV